MHHRESNPGPFVWLVKTLTIDHHRLLCCMHVLHTDIIRSRISIVMHHLLRLLCPKFESTIPYG